MKYIKYCIILDTQRRLQLRGTSTKRKITSSRRSISSSNHSWQPQKPLLCAPRSTRWTHRHIGNSSRTTTIRWTRTLRSLPRRQIHRPLVFYLCCHHRRHTTVSIQSTTLNCHQGTPKEITTKIQIKASSTAAQAYQFPWCLTTVSQQQLYVLQHQQLSTKIELNF